MTTVVGSSTLVLVQMDLSWLVSLSLLASICPFLDSWKKYRNVRVHVRRLEQYCVCPVSVGSVGCTSCVKSNVDLHSQSLCASNLKIWIANSTDTAKGVSPYHTRRADKRWRTESYKRVQFEPSDVSMSLLTCSSTALCVRPCWKRSRSWLAVCSPRAAKQGREESTVIEREDQWEPKVKYTSIILPFCISSTKATCKEIRTCIQWPIATGTH